MPGRTAGMEDDASQRSKYPLCIVRCFFRSCAAIKLLDYLPQDDWNVGRAFENRLRKHHCQIGHQNTEEWPSNFSAIKHLSDAVLFTICARILNHISTRLKYSVQVSTGTFASTIWIKNDRQTFSARNRTSIIAFQLSSSIKYFNGAWLVSPVIHFLFSLRSML